jgi:hypothetical protein
LRFLGFALAIVVLSGLAASSSATVFYVTFQYLCAQVQATTFSIAARVETVSKKNEYLLTRNEPLFYCSLLSGLAPSKP